MQTASRYPWGKGTPKWTLDNTANDSDKSYTVPSGKIWCLKFIEAALYTSATAGNRYLDVTITNGTNVIFGGTKTAAIAASKKAVLSLYGSTYYLSSPTTITSIAGVIDVPDVGAYGQLPEMYLPAGYVIRVYDIAATAAAEDDLTVSIHYIEYDA